jgi:gluconate kinase
MLPVVAALYKGPLLSIIAASAKRLLAAETQTARHARSHTCVDFSQRATRVSLRLRHHMAKKVIESELKKIELVEREMANFEIPEVQE